MQRPDVNKTSHQGRYNIMMLLEGRIDADAASRRNKTFYYIQSNEI